MEKAAQSDKENQPQPSAVSGARHAVARSAVAPSRLGQLADSINSSPRTQALAQLKEDIQRSTRVQGLHQLAKQMQKHSPPAQPEEDSAPIPNRTGLPDPPKAGVETLSGLSLDDVNVHYNSDKPAQLNALAYAQGTDVHVAPGQEKHLPHEAWHIVQQKQGRVRPTMQMKSGIPVNDEQKLEREADGMGARAANMKGQISGTTAQFRNMFSVSHSAVSRTIQRITIEDMTVTTRAGLTDIGFHDGGADQTEQMVIDEYLQRNPAADFDSNDRWMAEIRMRAELIKGMNLINDQGLFRYNWTENEWSLPPANWQDIRESAGKAAFAPKDKVSRLFAIRDLFTKAQTGGEKYYIDCSFAMLAVHYRAFAEAMETIRPGLFDQRFSREKVVLHPEGLERVRFGGRFATPPGDALHDTVKVKDLSGLLPGDWVYFKNFSDYEQTHSGPEAAWAGEHATYMGNGMYRGFGTSSQTYKEMVDTLIDRYNNQGTTSRVKLKRTQREGNKESLDGELPGIVEVRRAKHPFEAGK